MHVPKLRGGVVLYRISRHFVHTMHCRDEQRHSWGLLGGCVLPMCYWILFQRRCVAMYHMPVWNFRGCRGLVIVRVMRARKCLNVWSSHLRAVRSWQRPASIG
jgi:hypothetical protein